MSINITMPALSPTMEEGTLAKWLVKEGDTVEAGDVIAEIETDKATMEVEAVDEGVIAQLKVEAGTEGVKVNAVIAVLAEEGDDAGSLSASDAPTPAPTEDKPSEAIPPKAEEKTTAPPAAKPTASPNINSGERLFVTPLARRIAEQNGVDLSNVKGSGPRGRIVKADVEGAPSQAAGSRASGPPPVAAPSDAEVIGLFEEGSFDRRPHDGMRKVIAERLTHSNQTVPAYFITMECKIDKLLALRADMNAAAPKDEDDKPLWKISVNDFVVKAMAMALKAVPEANVSWTSTDRLYHKHSDVGVAVSVDDGLFTPIVRKAEEKSLAMISGEVKDMAKRARSKKLAPDEYQGGVTAVSNLGMFGVREFTSIINPPHASIVSIGAGEKRAVVVDGDLAVATVMAATFAFDHRAIDGALGAELAAAFKNFVEKPAGMLA